MSKHWSNTLGSYIARWPLRLAIAGLVFASSSFLVGTTEASAETPVRGGTLVGVVTPEPPILVSTLNASLPVAIISSKIFEGLFDLDENLDLTPVLAEKWSVLDGGRKIRVELRQGVKWHDGVPFTSQDVRFSMMEIWKKYHPHGKVSFGNVESVDTPDDHTVVFNLTRPSPVVLFALNEHSSSVLPKHIYEGTDFFRNPANIKPIGTGPFKFKEWFRNDRIVLDRNPNYWDAGRPYLDQVIFRIIPDATVRAASFERGDVAYGPGSPVDIGSLDRIGENSCLRIEWRGYSYIASSRILEFNLRRPFLSDVRVRRAIAHAIDLPNLLKVTVRNLGKVSTGPIPSSMARYYTADVPRYAYDLKAAEKLLDEAGYPRQANGTRFSIKLDWVPFGDTNRRVSEYLRQSLKRVGIEVEVRNLALANYFNQIYTDYDFDATISSLSMFGDPQIGAERLVWSQTILKGVPFSNASGYASPELDALIQEAHDEADAEARVQIYRKLQRIVQGDLPLLPLHENAAFTVHSARLNGLQVTPAGGLGDSLKEAWLGKNSKECQ